MRPLFCRLTSYCQPILGDRIDLPPSGDANRRRRLVTTTNPSFCAFHGYPVTRNHRGNYNARNVLAFPFPFRSVVMTPCSVHHRLVVGGKLAGGLPSRCSGREKWLIEVEFFLLLCTKATATPANKRVPCCLLLALTAASCARLFCRNRTDL